MQLIGSILLTISLAALSGCVTNPVLQISTEQPESDFWIIQVTTTGGSDGMAEGAWTIDSQGNVAAGRELEAPDYTYQLTCKGNLSEAGLQNVSQLVSSAEPSEWSVRYVNPQYPYGYADGVKVLFELRYRTSGGSESVYTASWEDAAMDQVPEELLSLYEETRLLSAAVLKGCEERK